MNNELHSGKRIAKNAGWMVAGKVFHMLLSLATSLLTARYLGPDNYGLINYAGLYITFFTALCTLGINSVIVKNFVDHPEEVGLTLGTTLLLRAVSSFLSMGLIIAVVSIVDAGEKQTVAVTALCSLALLFQVFDSVSYWFQSRLQSQYATIATSASYLVVSVYKVILLVTRKGVLWFALATSIDYGVSAVMLLAAYYKKGGPALHVSGAKARQLLNASKSFILCGLMVAFYNCTDRFMLKHMLDDAAVGHYSVASGICTMWTFVLTALIDSMYPSIMELHQSNRSLYERRNRQLYAIVFYVSVAVSLVTTGFAPLIVRILYGKSYLPAVQPLRVITWYTAFSYLGVARNAWMVSENKQKYLTPIYIGAALVNVCGNLLLIPLWGATGAAAASLLTQIATIFVFPYWIKDLRPNAKLMTDALLLRGVWKNKE